MNSDSVIDDGRHGRLNPRRRKSRFKHVAVTSLLITNFVDNYPK